MTTATPRPPVSGTRAEIRQPRRRPDASRPSRRVRANRWVAVLTVVFVLVAVGLGALAFLTWQDANDVRNATRPLEARSAQLHVDLSTADAAIDRLTALFGAIRAQDDATATAVDTANQAAQRFNTAQAKMADAFSGDVAGVGTALTQSTAAVRTAVDGATNVLVGLDRLAEDPANG